jgi:hypothetical protein
MQSQRSRFAQNVFASSRFSGMGSWNGVAEKEKDRGPNMSNANGRTVRVA